MMAMGICEACNLVQRDSCCRTCISAWRGVVGMTRVCYATGMIHGAHRQHLSSREVFFYF